MISQGTLILITSTQYSELHKTFKKLKKNQHNLSPNR